MIDVSKLWQMRDIMPVITVDFESGRILMHGLMNKEAFAYTLKTHNVWYYYPNINGVKMKGEHSGHIQKLVSIKTDCDFHSLLIVVEQVGFVCHKDNGHSSCFIHDIYNRDGISVPKSRKFGKIEIDENFDYSKEDYDDTDIVL